MTRTWLVLRAFSYLASPCWILASRFWTIRVTEYVPLTSCARHQDEALALHWLQLPWQTHCSEFRSPQHKKLWHRQLVNPAYLIMLSCILYLFCVQHAWNWWILRTPVRFSERHIDALFVFFYNIQSQRDFTVKLPWGMVAVQTTVVRCRRCPGL